MRERESVCVCFNELRVFFLWRGVAQHYSTSQVEAMEFAQHLPPRPLILGLVPNYQPCWLPSFFVKAITTTTSYQRKQNPCISLVQSKTPNELPIESSIIKVLKMRSINSTTIVTTTLKYKCLRWGRSIQLWSRSA